MSKSSMSQKKLLKGQLISKANCQAVNSSKKRTNEFVFTTMRRVFVCFLEEIKDSKKAFWNYLTFNQHSQPVLIQSIRVWLIGFADLFGNSKMTTTILGLNFSGFSPFIHLLFKNVEIWDLTFLSLIFLSVGGVSG